MPQSRASRARAFHDRGLADLGDRSQRVAPNDGVGPEQVLVLGAAPLARR